jgi:hypothetical protein
LALLSFIFLPKKNSFALIGGGMTPSLLVLIYLWSYNAFEDFLNQYILNNLAYSTRYALTFKEKFFSYLELTHLTPDTTFFFEMQLALLIIATLGLLKIRRLITSEERKLIALAFLLVLSSIYCIIQPGNGFYHYALLLLVPATLLTGVLVATLLTKYSGQNLYEKRNTYVWVILLVIFSSVILPVSKHNVAFDQAAANNFAAKNKSLVAQKILEHAKPNDRPGPGY